MQYEYMHLNWGSLGIEGLSFKFEAGTNRDITPLILYTHDDRQPL
jgi:hypothetical protein